MRGFQAFPCSGEINFRVADALAKIGEILTGYQHRRHFPVSPIIDPKLLDSEHNNEPFLRFPDTCPDRAALRPVAAD